MGNNTTITIAIITIVMSLSLSLSLTAYSETREYVFDFDASDLRLEKVENSLGEKFTKVRLGELISTGSEEEPELPVKYITVSVPTYSNNASVKLTDYKKVSEKLVSSPIEPSMGYDGDGEKLEPSYSVLTRAKYITSTSEELTPRVEVVDEFFVNGEDHFVRIAIHPASYSTKESKLSLYSKIKFDFNFERCKEEDMRFRPLTSGNGTYMYDISQLDIYGEIDPESRTRQRIMSTSEFQEQDETKNIVQHYVILCPEKLKEGTKGFESWKRQKGYNCVVETYENIYKNPNYVIGKNKDCIDKESSVREWMRNFYKTNGAFYCLLIGDYKIASVPIRRVQPGSTTPEDTHDYIPTDTYFTDLVTDWTFTIIIEQDTKTYIGQNCNTAKFSPTISTGRLLCSTKEEIENNLKKLVLYELYPGMGNLSYLKNGAIVRHRDFLSVKDLNIFNYLPYFEICELEDNGASVYADVRPYPTQIVNTMSNCNLISIQCHGGALGMETASWVEDGKNKKLNLMAMKEYLKVFHTENDKYDFSDPNNAGLDELSNKNKPSIIYTVACDTAPFDGWHIFKDSGDFNFASAFTCLPLIGGPTILANTRYGYREPSQIMEDHFSLYARSNSIGISENLSKLYFYSIPKIRFIHNIFGDSDFEIWRMIPRDNNKFHLPTFTNSKISLNIMPRVDGEYGIHYGQESVRRTFCMSESKMDIALPENFKFGKCNKVGSLFIKQKDCLPFTILLTTGETIFNQTDKFVLISGYFGKERKYNMPQLLNIGTNSDISIHCYDEFKSTNGILIFNGGKLKIEANKTISLSNDAVLNGGELNLKGAEIVLGSGFAVKKGAVLVITN